MKCSVFLGAFTDEKATKGCPQRDFLVILF